MAGRGMRNHFSMAPMPMGHPEATFQWPRGTQRGGEGTRHPASAAHRPIISVVAKTYGWGSPAAAACRRTGSGNGSEVGAQRRPFGRRRSRFRQHVVHTALIPAHDPRLATVAIESEAVATSPLQKNKNYSDLEAFSRTFAYRLLLLQAGYCVRYVDKLRVRISTQVQPMPFHLGRWQF